MQILDQYELQSAAWKKIAEHLKTELAERRRWNDGTTLNDTETAVVRGDIKRLKKMLSLDPAWKDE